MSTASDSFDRLLEECTEEPIRIPGSIQPTGCLVGIQAEGGEIVYASENTPKFLGRPSGDLLGQQARELLAPSLWEELLASVGDDLVRRDIQDLPGTDSVVHCIAHRSGPYIVCEFEPREDIDDGLMTAFYEMQENLLGQPTVEEILRSGVESVADLTGFDHVMVYRFHPNWDGEVVAEYMADELPSYQGHRFPASDIPKQARELYRENSFRMISDAAYEPVPIHATRDESLDLSRAWLRSVSPVHLKYLENMGVRASLSISIIVDGELWGLIACHHPHPRFLPHHRRRLVKFYGRQFSTQMALTLEERRQQYLNRYQDILQLPHRFLARERSLPAHLASRGSDFLELLQAEGLVVRMFGEQRTAGDVPPPSELDPLMEWLEAQNIVDVWHTDALAAESYPGAENIAESASGVLVVELPQNGSRLVWLRPELIQTIEWGGNPNKPVIQDSDEGSLSPRDSFNTWREQVENRAEPWRPEQVAAARVLREHLLEAAMAESRRRRSEQLDVIHQILRHDIQNKVGVIAAYADMLSDIQEPKMNRYARRISKASQDTIALTKSAWALAHVIRSGGEVERSVVAITPLVERMVESIEATHGDAVVTMDVSQTSGGDLSVMAGPLLDSVLRNLITNAVKHNDKDWKKVHVNVEELPETVRIHVADNGPGIPQSRREEIFVEGETRLDDSSTGIGLYLVRLITDRYDGAVWVQDNEPVGSIFTIELSKAEGEDES